MSKLPRAIYRRVINKLTIVCLLFVLLIGCNNSEQNDATIAEVESLTERAKELQRTDIDSAIILQQEAFSLAKSIKNKNLVAAVLREMGTSYSMNENLEKSDSCYYTSIKLVSYDKDLLTKANIYVNLGINQSKRGNVDSALVLYKSANDMVSDLDQKDDIEQRTVNNIAIAYTKKGQYDSAQVYLQKAIYLADENNDNMGKARALQNIGNIRHEMKDFDGSSRFFKQADSIYTLENNLASMMSIKINRVLALTHLSKYDEALEVSLQAEELAKKTGIRAALGSIYNGRGFIYYEQGQYPKCIEMQRLSMEIKNEFADTLGIINSLISLSGTYLNMSDFTKAKEAALEGLKLVEHKGSSKNKIDLYNNLAEAYGLSGDYKTASNYLVRKDTLKDSIFTKDKFETIHEMEVKYETEKKEQALQTASLNLQIQRKANIGLIILVLVLVVASTAIFYLQRQKMKNRLSLVQQNQKVAALTAKTLTPNCGNESNGNGLTEEKTNEILRSLRDCMDDKKMYRNPQLTLDMLANETNTNRSYLSSVISSRMKKGFVEYVNFYHVEDAKRLLRSTDNKITHIGKESGFGSSQTFYTVFKQFEQLTPGEYRKAAAEKIEEK